MSKLFFYRAIALPFATFKRQFEMASRPAQVSELQAAITKQSVGDADLGDPFLRLRLSKKTLGKIPSRIDFSTQQTPNTLAEKRGKPLSGTLGASRKIISSLPRGFSLVCRPAL